MLYSDLTEQELRLLADVTAIHAEMEQDKANRASVEYAHTIYGDVPADTWNRYHSDTAYAPVCNLPMTFN